MQVLSELREPPGWLDDAYFEDDVELPPIPDWLLDGPSGSDLIGPPCPCCTEPDQWPLPPQRPLTLPALEQGQRPPASPVVAAVRSAVEGLEALDRADLAGLPGAQELSDTAALLELSQRLRVHLTGRLADVTTRQLYALEGARSTRAWADRLCPDTDRRDVALSRQLRDFPLVQQALTTGDVTMQAAGRVAGALSKAKRHLDRPDGLVDGLPGDEVVAALVRNTVDLVARARMGLRDDDDPQLVQLVALTEHIVAGTLPTPGAEIVLGSQLEKVEAASLLLAQHLDQRVLRTALDEQLDALLPSVLEENADKAQDKAFLTLQRKLHGAGMRIVIDTDVETGELFWTCLTAEARRDPANPGDTATAAGLREEGVPVEDWVHVDAGLRPRSRGRRLHDAFHNLLQRYLAAGLAGEHDKAPVRVVVTVPAATVEGRPGAPPGRGPSGSPLPRSLIRRWWCDASVTALLMSRGWIPLGSSHSGRTLTRREREAVRVQHDGRCAGADCCTHGDPLVSLEPHHAYAFARYGRTSLEETVLACPRLHHDIHHGLTVRLRDGRWLGEEGFTSPPSAGWDEGEKRRQ